MKWATRRGRKGALFAAIAVGDSVPVRTLLELDPEMVNDRGENPPPLHWAIYRNRPKMVRILLDAGADIELLDRDRGATPLDYAIVYARSEIIRLLVARGADTDGRLDAAIKAAGGRFDAFAELPSRGEYERIVTLLREIGVNRIDSSKAYR